MALSPMHVASPFDNEIGQWQKQGGRVNITYSRVLGGDKAFFYMLEKTEYPKSFNPDKASKTIGEVAYQRLQTDRSPQYKVEFLKPGKTSVGFRLETEKGAHMPYARNGTYYFAGLHAGRVIFHNSQPA